MQTYTAAAQRALCMVTCEKFHSAASLWHPNVLPFQSAHTCGAFRAISLSDCAAAADDDAGRRSRDDAEGEGQDKRER